VISLDSSVTHAFWDNTLEPRASISPGGTVEFETLEGTGQVSPETPSEMLANLDPSLIHPLTGPVYIEGAERGDTLVVEVLALEHHGWGWNGVIPGFGLLATEFSTPYIHHYQLEEDRCVFRQDIHLPFEPFCGVMGVAPAEAGRLETSPPRPNAGNIDIRQLTPGATALFPVLVTGALFSCGDCHSAQGDGEVNGTGVETPMTVALRFGLRKNESVPELQFWAPPAGGEKDGSFMTTAHGPDLHACAQQAIRYMLDHLVAEYDLSREQAYCLCGAAVNLRISEVVNEPNWIVSAQLPLGIFRTG
jgi:acetamidase/formamidase